MSDELYLLDTNILVYAVNADSEHHEKAAGIVNKAIACDIRGAVCFQNLVELYSVVTSSRVEKPLAPVEAGKLISDYLELKYFKLCMFQTSTIPVFIDLVKKYQPKAQAIYDFKLTAVMIENGIKNIISFNEKHFRMISEIKVITP